MAVMAMDGGGGHFPQPSAQAQTHVVTATDTVQNLAERYGITQQALREANPEVFQDPSVRRRDAAQSGGELLLTGETINIPAASQSVVEDPAGSDFVPNPTYPSPKSEYTVTGEGQHAAGSVTWNPGDGSIKLTGTQIVTPPGQTDQSPLQYSARTESAVTAGQVNKNIDGKDYTEFTVEVQFTHSTNVEGQNRTSRGLVEGEASVGAGTRARYKVLLPGKDQSAEAAARVNPFDPTTIPDGATVMMDGQNFTQGSLAGSFRHIGVQTNVTDAAGVTYAVTRDGNDVRVTMGPNQAVEAFNGIGLRSEIASAMLGRQDNLGGSTLATATFDLSNPDGQAAYAHFVATGQVAHETAGVDDVATIERIDYSSQTRALLELGPVQANLAGAQNTGTFVRTTYPDGSYTFTTELQYSGNVPLQVTQRFDAAGHEVTSERSYEFKVSTDHTVDLSWWDNMWGRSDAEAEASRENSHTQLLNWALTGGSESGPAQAGKTMTISFTEAQMQALHGQTTAAAAANESGLDTLRLLTGGEDGMPVNSTFDFAVAMARNLGGDSYGFAERLFEISSGADGDIANGAHARIDASVTVK
ncbi:LysM peptidoglycan-binding domain-containing protein [Luteimonas sp. SDU101]|uniref:LysM peptidoglycan-binding domain-containing protein n=1 Tax=Luteimonas sp. SDU101 TaxID=3422593 RepID=UPI003EB9AE10